MRANDTRRKAIRNDNRVMPATKTVAFNPISRRYEEVDAESETGDDKVITMYWCRTAGCYVTIPGRADD